MGKDLADKLMLRTIPIKRKITIHREGRKILLSLFFLLLLINVATLLVWPGRQQFDTFLMFFSLALFSGTALFFRNPVRATLIDNSSIIAPADGKVVAIEEVEEPEYFKDKRIQVSIFMSPANVHVNRNPISGQVKYTQYHPGRYFFAWHPKSSKENEHNSVVIGGEDLDVEILVKQIAGAFARRIVSYINVGDEVVQGNELGFIKFGSRVDLFLPLDTVIGVELNQKVKGGETVIASLIET